MFVSLTPGAEIVAPVLANIDRDADGVLSAGEQRAYADKIVGRLASEGTATTTPPTSMIANPTP